MTLALTLALAVSLLTILYLAILLKRPLIIYAGRGDQMVGSGTYAGRPCLLATPHKTRDSHPIGEDASAEIKSHHIGAGSVIIAFSDHRSVEVVRDQCQHLLNDWFKLGGN